MGVVIKLDGFMGYPKYQEFVVNDLDAPLSALFNDARVVTPVTHEDNMVFAFWSTTISGQTISNRSVKSLINSGYGKDGTIQLYANFSYNPSAIQLTFSAGNGAWTDGRTEIVLSKPAGTSYAELYQDITDNPVYSVSGTAQSFDGWFDDKGKQYNSDDVFYENTLLTASFSKPTNITLSLRDVDNKVIKTITTVRGSEYRDIQSQFTYVPSDYDKPLIDVVPGRAGYEGQQIVKINFSGTNSPLLINHLTQQKISEYTNTTIDSLQSTDIPFDFTQNGWTIIGKSNGKDITIQFRGLEDVSSDSDFPGIFVNNKPIWNGYTLSWVDATDDLFTFIKTTKILTFSKIFGVLNVSGSSRTVQRQITQTVKRVLLDYGLSSISDPIYPNTYFYKNDIIMSSVGELYGFAMVRFINSNTGYSQTVYLPTGSKFSDFMAKIDLSNYTQSKYALTGFWWTSTWSKYKMLPYDIVSSIQDGVYSQYQEMDPHGFVQVTANAAGGSFYPGTPDQIDSIYMNVDPTDTWSQVTDFLPIVTKGKMRHIYWYIEGGEPAYTQTVSRTATIYPKWSVEGTDELYRYPREYYLVDMDTIINGWDLMDKFNISNKRGVFVINPKGVGTEFDNTDSAESLDGWNSGTRTFKSNNISFTAYYNDYQQYIRLGSWMNGKNLAIAMLNDTGVPTYWKVGLSNFERTEIKYGSKILEGDLEFIKMSSPFELEFIGLGTDSTINNTKYQAWKTSYLYMQSLKVVADQSQPYIMARHGDTVLTDKLLSKIKKGQYMEYSTIPFMERWNIGDTFGNYDSNQYSNIDLINSQPMKLPKGQWDIFMSSDTLTTISQVTGVIDNYKNTTIDSLGTFGPFIGIALKEKEI